MAYTYHNVFDANSDMLLCETMIIMLVCESSKLFSGQAVYVKLNVFYVHHFYTLLLAFYKRVNSNVTCCIIRG